LNSEPEKEKIDLPQDVIDLANARLTARNNKDWAKSDELRAAIEAKGFSVKDIAGGYEISAK
ncbi:MAG: cysteine--tRNA ligase, partial [Clostridia bacterium]